MKEKVVIEIENLTEAQSIALEDMMRTWMYLESIGASRYTSYFADGDGSFHPKILFNGHKPKNFINPNTQEGKKIDPEYKIDFDEIAWLLYDYRKEELQRE